MVLAALLKKGTVIAHIKEDDLRQERIRLEMEQERSFKKIEDAEKQKQALFKEMLNYNDKARIEAVANKISTLDTKVRLEQSAIRAIGRQLKLIYTVETIKGFQRRNFQSPLVKRLLGARVEEVNKVLVDLIASGQGIDELTREFLNAIGFAMPETDKEVEELVKMAQEVREQLANDPDAAAEALRQRWNKQKGLEAPETA